MKSIFKLSLLLLFLSESVFAQWIVKSKFISEQSQDSHISLVVEFPVLVGDFNPTSRKAINHALGQISGVDGLISDAKRMIVDHKRAIATKKRNPNGSDADDINTEDFADEHSLEYKVGINDARLFSVCFIGYWHGGGGVVGNPYWKTGTFDSTTGIQLQPTDIFLPNWEATLKIIAKPFLQEIGQELADDWENRLKDANITFYFTSKNLIVGFEKYSIAPGASGVVSIEIPLNKIRSIVPSTSKINYLVK
jgi:hypothetical protein